jgi:hypothetical protein
MPDQFGGVPINDQKTDQFGGIPISDDQQSAQPAQNAQQPSLGEVAKREGMSALGQIASNANPANVARGAWSMLTHPIDTLTSGMSGYRQQAKLDLEKGKYADAALYGLSGIVPGIGPLAGQAADALGSGDPEAIGRSAGNIASIKAVPSIYHGFGKAIGALAPPIMEKAMRITGEDRNYGATPGTAIRDYTSGFRPETVQRSAQASMKDLGQQKASILTASPESASLVPPLKAHANFVKNAAAGGSDVSSFQPMREQLAGTPQPGFTGATVQPPAPITQVPSKILGPNGQPVMVNQTGPLPQATIAARQSLPQYDLMRQRFAQDYTNFNPRTPRSPEETGLANTMYGEMAKELERKAPGISPLNQTIQSLVPVARKAGKTALADTAMQNAMGRIARPTGALTAALAGLTVGGIPGMIAGLGVPEMISDPTSQMIAARGLAGTGKALGSPTANAAIAASQLKKKKPQD